MFDKRLRLETQALSGHLEEFKKDRTRLEAANSALEVRLGRARARLAELHQVALISPDVVILIPSGAGLGCLLTVWSFPLCRSTLTLRTS